MKSIAIYTNGETIDFSNHTLLEKLRIDGDCHVTNISNCTSLTDLCFYKNNKIVSTIDLRQMNALKNVTLFECWSLTSINLSGSQHLDSLSFRSWGDNEVDIDISYCNHLRSLTLDVSGCTSLTTLTCYNNEIKELDVHSCVALNELYCYSNSNLATLILNKNHQISKLFYDDHTQIIQKE